MVTVFYDIFQRLLGTKLCTLQITLRLVPPPTSQTTLPHSETPLEDMDMAFIHDASAQTQFDALQDVTVVLESPSRHKDSAGPTEGACLTEEETERRIRSILQPWDSRGILAVTLKDYIAASTAEEDSTKASAHPEQRSENDIAALGPAPILATSSEPSATFKAMPLTVGEAQ